MRSEYIQPTQEENTYTEYVWSQTNVVGTYHRWFDNGYNYSGPMSEWDWLMKTVPDAQFDHSVPDSSYGEIPFYVQTYFAKGVRHTWQVYGGQAEQTLSARTRMTLYTGGKSGVSRSTLISVGADVSEFFKPEYVDWYMTPSRPVDPASIEIFGQAVDATKTVWKFLPNNSTSGSNIQAKEAKHFQAPPRISYHRPKLYWEMIDATGRTNIAWAGQHMDLSLGFEPDLAEDAVATNHNWTVPGTPYADINYSNNVGVALRLTNFATARLDYYWAEEFAAAEVKCSVAVQGVTNLVNAFFNVRKPQVSWTLTPHHPVAVTNRVDEASLGLMCGRGYKNEDMSQVGMEFAYKVIDRKGFKGGMRLSFVQLITTSTLVTSTNSSDTPFIFHASNVLDTRWPNKEWLAFEGLNTSGSHPDSPIEGISSRFYEVTRNDAFHSYLLFTPVGGKPVPLKVADWSWSGTVRRSETNNVITYVFVSPPQHPLPGVGVNCSDPPSWTDNVRLMRERL